MSAPAKIGRSARNDPKIAEKEVRFNPFTYIVGLVKIAIFGEDPTFEEEEATWRSYDQATLLAMYDEMHTQAEEEERKRTTGQKYDGCARHAQPFMALWRPACTLKHCITVLLAMLPYYSPAASGSSS